MAPSNSQALASTPLITTKSAQPEAQSSYVTATKKCAPCHTTKPLYTFFSEPKGDVAVGKICYNCRLLPQLRRSIQKALASKAKAEVRTEALKLARIKIETWHANVDAVGLAGLVDDRQWLLEFCTTKIDAHMKNPAVATPPPNPSKLKHTFPYSKTAPESSKRVKTDIIGLPTPVITPVPKSAVKPKQKKTAVTRRSRRSISPILNDSQVDLATPDFSNLSERDLRAKVAANKARLVILDNTVFSSKQARFAATTAEHATLSSEAERLRDNVEEAKKKQKAAIDAYNEAAKQCNVLKEELEGLEKELDAEEQGGSVECNGEVKRLEEEQELLKERLLEIGRERIEGMFV